MWFISQPLIAPWFRLNSGCDTTLRRSISAFVPNPSHAMHAPEGLLNENNLGSNSGMLYPHIEHAILVE